MGEIVATIIEGHQQGSSLLWAPEEKHLFVKKSSPTKKGDIDWICYQTILCQHDPNETKCTSRLKRSANGICVRKSSSHTDHKDHALIYNDLMTKQKIVGDCLQFNKLCEGLAMKIPVNDFFTRELTKRPFGECKLKLKSVEKNVARRTKKKRPQHVKTPDSIARAFENAETLNDFGLNMRKTERFYIDTIIESGKRGEPDVSFTLFASLQMIDLIKKHIPPQNRRYMMDATFDITPLGSYYQLLVIYIEYSNDVFPIFYVLMSCKTTKAYQSVFQYIENNIFNLEPSQFLTDFEAGLRKALELCYPFAIILGCWFHYCSAIRRRVMSLRLYKLIAENRNARSIYKKIMSLPLLPPESILEGYEIILNEAETNRLSRTFKKVFEYYERFWLHQNEKHSLSVMDLPMRTTSSLEGFNSVMNRSIPKNGNFFTFVERLKIHESRKADEMFNLLSSNKPPKHYQPKHSKDQKREEKIRINTDLLRSGQIDTSTFLTAMVDEKDDVSDYYYDSSEISTSDSSDDE